MGGGAVKTPEQIAAAVIDQLPNYEHGLSFAKLNRVLVEAFTAYRTGQLVAVADDAIERYRHVKRGTVYEVVGEAELQMNADNLVDGSQMMVYRGEDGKLWCRHYDEFHDGRFESLAVTGTSNE